MDGFWIFKNWFLFRVPVPVPVLVAVVVLLFVQNLSVCWSLNDEGLSLLRFRESVGRDPYGALLEWNINGEDIDPCLWFGIECSDGKVVILNLRDLCLGGTLSSELGNLSFIKSIILRNNSFHGNIPKEIVKLEELEVLDLGYNNFSGTFPLELGNNLSLAILLLDNNELLSSMSPELDKLKVVSETQIDESELNSASLGTACNNGWISWNTAQPEYIFHRRLQQEANAPTSPAPSPFSPGPSPFFTPSPSPSPSLAQSPSQLSPAPSPSSPSPESPLFSPSIPGIFVPPTPSPMLSPHPSSPSPAPANPPAAISSPPPPLTSPASSPSSKTPKPHKSKSYALMWSGAAGCSLIVCASVIGMIIWRRNKLVSINPWVTGLSGQLRRAFVTGVPQLNRSELETACEDFSNIIGKLSDGMVYKGTLSSGVEIAVKSSSVTSSEDWSKNLEAQFREKIDTLSKVNHKNFVNLIGYCEEEEPFTRMMVFEYASNGTLFEHLHIKEAEHLDWQTRLRVAMGMAYCLEHMHQLVPPVAHRNLHSCSIYLTEDYAAKISDLSAPKPGPALMDLLEIELADPENNVYSFGVILLEMITGKFPYSVTPNYLAGEREQPPNEIVDPTLKCYGEEELAEMLDVIKVCMNPDPKQRPKMTEVAARLKEITSMGPDKVTPKGSTLWWAELEIMSTSIEGN